jgi:two-component system sensor histidine kinase BarA
MPKSSYTKFWILLVLPMTFALVFSSVIFTRIRFKELNQEFCSQFRATINDLSQQVSNQMLTEDVFILEQLIKRERASNANIIHINFFTSQGKVLASSKSKSEQQQLQIPTDNLFALRIYNNHTFLKPILLNAKPFIVGWIEIEFNDQLLQGKKQYFLRNLLLSVIAIWLLFIAIITIFFKKNSYLSLQKQEQVFLLEQINTLKASFVEPLQKILGTIMLAEKTELNSRQTELIQNIESYTKYLLTLVQKVTDISQIRATCDSLKLEKIDIYDVLEDTVREIANYAYQYKVELVPFIYSDVPQFIVSDALRIKQILNILIKNAITFSKAEHVVIRMALEKLQENDLTISFSLPETGLGLSIEELNLCKDLIAPMRGSISLLGFSITVNHLLIATNDGPNTAVQSPKKRALLFEEHSLTRMSIKHLLEKNGVEAVEISNLNTINQLIIDAKVVQVPFDYVIIGLDLYARKIETIRNLINKLRNITIIVLSNSNTLRQHHWLEHGVAHCIEKPISSKAFKQILNQNFSQQYSYMKDLQVLIIEHNKQNIIFISKILSEINCQFHIIDDGKQSIEFTKNHIFDLIFVNLSMPKMNAIEIAKEIKQDNNNCNQLTPIVALTANVLENNIFNQYKNLFLDCLEMPFNEAKIRSIIQSFSISECYPQPSVSLHPSLATSDTKLPKSKIAYPAFKMLLKGLKKEQDDINNYYMAFQRSKSTTDLDQLRHLLHNLHGACCYTETPRLKQVVVDLEKTAHKDPENLQPYIHVFNTAVNELLSLVPAVIN